MATSTVLTNKPINPRGDDNRPVDSYNRASLYSGKALSFDGVNDFIDISAIDKTIIQSAFSFHTIIKKENNAADNDRIIDITIDSNNAFNLITDEVSQKYAVYLKISGIDKVNKLTYLPIVFDELATITFTWDGSNGAFYYNGQLVESTGSTSISFATAGAFLGKRTDAIASTFFQGHMSGARLFNTALTAAQVADLYNNPEKIVPTGVSNTALKLWLPMMEGAGTTAYDGSGNGNHGAISGATWTHGVGAPVAQSAVIDWNKGTNLITYSEELDNSSSALTLRGFSQNSSTETSPIGTSDAYKFTENDTNDNPALFYNADYSDGNSQTFKVYLKADASTTFSISTQGGIEGIDINVTTEWAQYEVTQPHNNNTGPHIGGFNSIARNSGVVLYVWHPQMSYGDSVYVPTFATAQTTPVLLPQGLTSGRDITGVNLFENVRKQGALNLDGNSWAEVHDNASFNMTTNITAEAWVYWKQTSGSNDSGILARWNSVTGRQFLIYHSNNITVVFYTGTSATSYSGMTEGWHHIVGTYDGANRKLYLDGALVGNTAYTLDMPSSNEVVEIGRYAHGDFWTTDDIVAQPRIYNRALTASEVLNNYNATKTQYQ